MKSLPSSLGALCVALCLTGLNGLAANPAFRFEGGLLDGGNPANGTYDMTFELFDAASNGVSAGSHTNLAVSVAGGVYEVLLPFAPVSLNFTNVWLQVAARTNGAVADRVVLSPRSQLTAVPYASKAALADGVLTGSIGTQELKPAAVTLDRLNLAGAAEGHSIVRRGTGLVWENLAFWSLLGNAGTTPANNFIGTTDNQAFEVRVNNQRALSIAPGALGPNIIAGAADNQVTAGRSLATIGGGGGNRVGGNAGTVAGGQGNDAAGLVATIGGGFGNSAAGARATVGGGSGNAAAGTFSTISGGGLNTATGNTATVAGGSGNTASGTFAFVGGGQNHLAAAAYATIAGGQQNRATNLLAFVGGGAMNIAGQDLTFVGAGRSNAAFAASAVVVGGENNTGAGGFSSIGGGRQNLTRGVDSTVAGGRENSANGISGAVAGGWLNEAAGSYSAVPGGVNNTAAGFASMAAGQSAMAVHDGTFVWADNSGADFASTARNQFLIRADGGVGIGRTNPQSALDVNGTVRTTGIILTNGAAAGRVLTADATGNASWQAPAVRIQTSTSNPNLIGGANNVISNNAVGATISGGFSNRTGYEYTTIGGGRDNRTYGANGTVSGGRGNRVEAQAGTIAGGQQNTASSFGATVSGGQQNTASGYGSLVAGGIGNQVSGQFSSINGGLNNVVTGGRAAVGGGSVNRADGQQAVTGGGSHNWATGDYSVVGGGDNNIAGEEHSTVSGGFFNSASGRYSTVAGGLANFAIGESSFAAGQFAYAEHHGSFVWSDASSLSRFGSTGDNQFLIRAGGGVGIGNVDPRTALDVAGTIRSRVGGVEFPDGSVQSTAAFVGWGFSNGVVRVAQSVPFVVAMSNQVVLRIEPNSVAPNFIAGAADNQVTAGRMAASIGGGLGNTVGGTAGTVSGGQGNTAGGLMSTVGGGSANTASGSRSTVAGGSGNTTSGSLSFVGGGSGNTAGGVSSVVAGGSENRVTGTLSAIVGGSANVAVGSNSFIGGGTANSNHIDAVFSVIGGGVSNVILGQLSVVAGGLHNRIVGDGAVIGGGDQNRAEAWRSTVAGGSENRAGRTHSTVGGGWRNEAAGDYATVAGGVFNGAYGFASFAAGQLAKAKHDGTFVWADINGTEFPSTGRNQFLIRADGGVGIGLNNPQTALDVNGAVRARTGGFQFPDGTTQATAAFNGWSFTSNILSSTANLPFAIDVAGQRFFRIAPSGVGANFISGADNSYTEAAGGITIGGGSANSASGQFGVVSGGRNNRYTGEYSVMSGGRNNLIQGDYTTIGGGSGNTARNGGTVSGGQANLANFGGSVGGGSMNQAGGFSAVISGGISNVAAGAWATVGGGATNQAVPAFATVSGGGRNTVGFSAMGGTVAGGLRNFVELPGGVISGGERNTNAGRHAFLGGGHDNTISSVANESVLGGGVRNLVPSPGAVLAGGMDNVAAGQFSTVGGGWYNETAGQFATVPGGFGNEARGLSSFAAGQLAIARHGGTFVWNDARGDDFSSSGPDQFLIRAGGGVGIGTNAPQAALHVNGSAKVNALQIGDSATPGNVFTTDAIGKGTWQPPVSNARLTEAVVAASGPGSGFNTDLFDGLDSSAFARSEHSHDNRYWSLNGNTGLAPTAYLGTADNHPLNLGVNGQVALRLIPNGVSPNLVAGHGGNSIAENVVGGVVAGGGGETGNNGVEADFATVSGGSGNVAAGMYSTVAGGSGNTAAGQYSFAAGRRAQANHNGAITLADGRDSDFNSTAPNEFAVRAFGGVRFVTGQTAPNSFSGARLAPGSGSWSSLSDRNAKKNVQPIDSTEVLERVAALPISTWNYRSQADEIRHMGPMAQDFRAAFGLGEDDRTISTVDTDGVALAAIQGLNQKLEARSAEVEKLKHQNTELLRRLEALEQRLK